jgi:lipopolysaccharide transport system ATP-binding protein
MSDIAIRAQNLSKSYQITHSAGRSYKTLQEEVVALVKRPFSKRDAVPDRETFWALKDVSFEVRHGEVLGIIGRNGAGKSTLLKVLSRITKPTSGYADVYGRIGSLLEVGTGFHPELTGRENIFLSGAVLGMTRRDIKKHFDEIVAFAETEQFLDTPAKRYSSGMYMRLAFAVAAHLEPEVLIIDEVLAVGDAEFQKKCLGKMREVAHSGRTVLFVSHQLGAIEQLCTRVIWLDAGTVRQSGQTREMVAAYLSALSSGQFVAQKRGAFQVTDITLRNADGVATNVFAPGDDIDIQVHYSADRRFEKPYLWISIDSQWGPLCSANMVMDGRYPDMFEGEGFIGCRFKNVPLLPQTYTLQMAIHTNNGEQTLFAAQEIGSFEVAGRLSDYGLYGARANVHARESTPFVNPYEWYYQDGTRIPIQIEPKKVEDVPNGV